MVSHRLRACVLYGAVVFGNASHVGREALLADEESGSATTTRGLAFSAQIPRDVALYVAWKGAQRSVVCESVREACVRFANEGGFGDLLRVALTSEDGSVSPIVEPLIAASSAALSIPRWRELAYEGGAFALRVTGPVPELLVLFRHASSETPAHASDLRRAFASLASAAPDFLAYEESDEDSEGDQNGGSGGGEDGAESRARLSLTGSPIAIDLAARDGLLLLSTSRRLLREALELEAARSGSHAKSGSSTGSGAQSSMALAEDPRFIDRPFREDDAVAELFVDLQGTFSFISRIIGEGDPDAEAGAPRPKARLARALLDELSFIDHAKAAIVERSRESLEWRSELAFRDGGSSLLARAFFDQEPIAELLERLPADRSGLAIWTGWSPGVIAFVLEILARDGNDAEETAADTPMESTTSGERLATDVGAWLDGSGAWIEIDGGNETPAGRALILRLSHQLRAERRSREILAAIRSTFRDWRQELVFETVSWSDRFIVLQMSAWPRLRWCVGTVAGALVIATSESAARSAHEAWEGGIARSIHPRGDAQASQSRGETVRARIELDPGPPALAIAEWLRQAGFRMSFASWAFGPNDGSERSRALGRLLARLGDGIASVSVIRRLELESDLEGEPPVLETRAVLGGNARQEEVEEDEKGEARQEG